MDGYDAVFFVAGEPEALRAARAARFLAATPRELPTLLEGGVRLDLLVGSGTDPGERYEGGLDAGIVVLTEGGPRRGCRRPPFRGRARPGRSSTPTAPATRSRPRSASRSPAATISTRRWRSRRGRARP